MALRATLGAHRERGEDHDGRGRAAIEPHAVDDVRGEGRLTDTADVFAEARRLTTWHYQWLIVNEFLPQIAGQDLVRQVLRRGRRFDTPGRGRGQ